MTRSDDITYQEIVERLKGIAGAVARRCIPNGAPDGVYWRGDLRGKVSVHVKGARVGMVGFWQGQAGNAKGGGNLIDLIGLAFNCQTHGEAVRIAKETFLGIGKRELTPAEKRAWAKQQEETERDAVRRRQADEKAKAEKIETVQSIWREAVPIAGTPAEAYLHSRMLELSDLPGLSSWMPSLRFHPSVMLGRDRHPALIGGVQSQQRKLVALWRIPLQPDGKALLGADGKKIKLGFGPAAGGAVRLAPVGPVLRLTEGIETGLGVMGLTACRVPVWATLSTSGMVGFQIPAGVRRIEIYADADRYREGERGGVLDPPGIRAAKALQERAIRDGVEAVIHPSPEPDDWLDVFQARKRDRLTERAAQYITD